MATLLLTAGAMAFGKSALVAGLGTVAGSLATAAAFTAAGVVGGMIDGALFGGSSATQKVAGPRLNSLDLMTSNEGAGVPRVDGRVRIGGEMIWSTRLEEVVETDTQRVQGGKGVGGGGSQKVETTTYSYFANFALALCEGPISHVGRIWLDGMPLDRSLYSPRVYHGTETQDPDPLILAKEGAAPAYRGIAYLVFERLPLEKFGNRIPQVAAEVFGPANDVEPMIRGFNVIPASTEWGYSPDVIKKVSRDDQGGIVETWAENANRYEERADFAVAMDDAKALVPNLETVSLAVAWFGDDLRAGSCKVEPRVEIATKSTHPHEWRVAGLTRADVPVVSWVDDRPAYGSSPSEYSVRRAIQDLAARGFRVMLHPFLLMDVPPGNGLPDPYGGAEQASFPWRGRITSTADGTAQARADVEAFFGAATAADFAIVDGEVRYIGDPADKGWRRFVLWLALVAREAGGVESIVVGSELRGIDALRDETGAYPGAEALAALIGDVRAIGGSTFVGYQADWSQWANHRPDDGSGDVFFHLDSVWMAGDFVGVSWYVPLADWRPGVDHLDYDPAGATTTYHLPYLKANAEGGEGFAWYYASEADRVAQVRTPIVDTAHGEDWVFRFKDLRSWWSSAHHNRPGGARSATPTAWVPQSRPIWLCEVGCPAIDLGANQPNVFVDPKSSESFAPYFSRGTRDDYMPRQYLRAMLEHFADPARNPPGMVDLARVYVWAWDARPWPEFPNLESTWADGPNWRRGHWWNGRAGSAPAADAIARRLARDYPDLPVPVDLSDCHGQADGYVARGPISFREWLQPWELAIRLDAIDRGGSIAFVSRAAARPVGAIAPEDMVDDADAPRFSAVRAALEGTPRAAVIRFADGDRDYQGAGVRVAYGDGAERGIAEAETPLVLDLERAASIAETWLRSVGDGRESLSCAIPPSFDAVGVGGLLTVALEEGDPRVYIVERATQGEARGLSLASFPEGALAPSGGVFRTAPKAFGPAVAEVRTIFADLPLPPDAGDDFVGYMAAHAKPWPGGVDVWRSPEAETGFALRETIARPASIGETLAPLPPGRLWVWSGEALEVRLFAGSPVSRPEVDVFAGANALAVEHPDGWEVIQFRDATFLGGGVWRLSPLLRGQRGTEHVRAGSLAAGARVVLLDGAIVQTPNTPGEVGRLFHWRTGPAGRDPFSSGFALAPYTVAGVGRRPFAPVHLRAIADGLGGFSASWVRRTRREGDRWPEDGDVPLAEVFERYRVEVRVGGDLAHAENVDAPAFVYPEDRATADGVSGLVEVRVAQVSETFGPGAFAAVSVNL